MTATRRMIRQLCSGGATVSTKLRGLLNAGLALVAPSARVDGIRVAFLDSTLSDTEAIAKLTAALQALAALDPRRYRVVRAHVCRVLVWPGHYDASDGLGGVLLAAERLREAELVDVVGTLVHEATHLRIARLGVPYRRARRERIERLCLEEQVRSLIQCGLLERELAERVRATLRDEWWSAESQSRDRSELLRRVLTHFFANKRG